RASSQYIWDVRYRFARLAPQEAAPALLAPQEAAPALLAPQNAAPPRHESRLRHPAAPLTSGARRHHPAERGAGRPIGLGNGSTLAQIWETGVRAAAISAVTSGPSLAHGRAAAQSVAFSTAACASRPALVSLSAPIPLSPPA